MWWFHAADGNRLTNARAAELFCCSSCLSLEPSLFAMIKAVSNGLPGDVLIVEDDPIIAMDFEDTVLRFGVNTVRTAGNVSRALQLIEERVPDFALLDISLVREKSFAVAERLEMLGIPFAFISGYGVDAALPAGLAQTPRLPKPCTADAMHAMLRSAVTRVVE
jgi:DNA-binding NtrC family response regulator